MYTKDLTPKMVEEVDAHCAEVLSVLCKGSIRRVVKFSVYIILYLAVYISKI